MKKRWIILAVLSLGTVAAFVLLRSKPQTVIVNTTTLKTSSVEKTVSCSGIVEAGEYAYATANASCVVGEVFAEVGKYVKKGQRLLSVDKDATEKLYQTGDRVGNALDLATMTEYILSPTDGVVVSVDALSGGVLQSGLPCVTIAPQSALQVRVLIREKQLPSLRVGQSVRVSGAGFDKEVYHGRLSEISFAANTDMTGAESVVDGVVTLDEGQSDASMRLGLTAKVKVVVSGQENVLLVPYEAVMSDENEECYVYVVKNNVASRRSITPIEEYADGVSVDQTQLVGCEVVTQPSLITRDGMTVQIATREESQ